MAFSSASGRYFDSSHRTFCEGPRSERAYSPGGTVVKMLEFLPRPVEESPRHEVVEFMSFVGCGGWTVFYSESLSVEIQGVAGSHALSIWPVHKVDLGGHI